MVRVAVFGELTIACVCVCRRCMNRVFNDYGVFHFVSRSFTVAAAAMHGEVVQASVDELMKRVSTVVIDEDESDSFTVRLDSKGFHPSTVAVRKVRPTSTTDAHSVNQ